MILKSPLDSSSSSPHSLPSPPPSPRSTSPFRMAAPQLPPLPNVAGDQDIVRALYAHGSLRRPGAPMVSDYGDADRLASIGAKVWDLVLVSHFFQKRPLLAATAIEESLAAATSDDALRGWSEGYGLSDRMFMSPDAADANVMSNPEHIRNFMHVYAGALYTRNGMATVARWITDLVDPTHVNDGSPMMTDSNSSLPEIGASPPSYHDVPSSPTRGIPAINRRDSLGSASNAASSSSAIKSNGPASNITLALFNETAMRKKCVVSWSATSTGPPHNPSWTAVCSLDNIERGTGTANGQKLAKELAAKHAWSVMGW